MFVRIKKAGRYEYLQVVENHREKGKSVQKVIATLGRIDQLKARGEIEGIVRSLSRFSERPLLLLPEKNGEVATEVRTIGPFLVFERLWQESGLREVFRGISPQWDLPFSPGAAVFHGTLHALLGKGMESPALPQQYDRVVFRRQPSAGELLPLLFEFLGGNSGESDYPAPSARYLRDEVERSLFVRRHQKGAAQENPSLFVVPVPSPSHGRAPETEAPSHTAAFILDGKGLPLCSEVWSGCMPPAQSLIRFLERSVRRFEIPRPRIFSEYALRASSLKKGGLQYVRISPEDSGYNGVITQSGELRQMGELLRNSLSAVDGSLSFPPSGHTVRGLVLMAFIALLLLHELHSRLSAAGLDFDWSRARRELETLREVSIEEKGTKFLLFTGCSENCLKIVDAAGVALPGSASALS